MRISSSLFLCGLSAVLLGLFGCGVEASSRGEPFLWPSAYEDAGPLPVDAYSPPVDAGPGSCRQAHAYSLPQRLITMTGLATHTDPSFTVQQLYDEVFNPPCGGACHGALAAGGGQGGWKVATPADLATKIDDSVIHRVTSDKPTDWAHPNDPTDPNDPMPPTNISGWIPYSERLPTDLNVIFAKIFQAWIDEGKPNGTAEPFVPPAGILPTATSGRFVTSSSVGTDMTNIGNCVPDATRVAQSRLPTSIGALQAMDAMFAGLFATTDSDAGPEAQLGLPPTLSATDFSSADGTTATFDSDALATRGVIAYQPTYPNWFDGAMFIRHVRVPIGQSIHFDKSQQAFAIPDNTRFYETIVRRVADTDGSYRWRKMETRIVVARNPRTAGAPLIGTYDWDANETDAALRTFPRHNGLPFAAGTTSYTTDELVSQATLAENPQNPTLQLVLNRAERHYAVLSVDQCGACHQGTAAGNFVLGFTPLQLNRRPVGRGA